jgi:hypothetical protein
MTTPDFSQTPYRRGVAHLMNFEHELAIAEFTEAFRLEPDAPNAYIGRAMAYRRRGNNSAARDDEEQAKRLGGAERNAWERLYNRAHRRWRGEFDDPRWKREEPLSRNAVLLDKLTGQIHNGGLHQWIANGYWRWIEDVITAAREINTDTAREVAAMLEDLSPHLDPELLRDDGWDEEEIDDDDEIVEEDDHAVEQLGAFEDRYYRLQMQFVEDVTEWFEKAAAGR